MNIYQKWIDLALDSSQTFPHEDALTILRADKIDSFELAIAAGKVRMKTFGKKVKLHQINNIQNGLCPEDCGYCGQSKETEADLPKYAMKSEDEIVQEAKEAKEKGAFRYCMVSSGRGLNDKRTEKLAKIITRIRDEVGIKTCLSAGFVSIKQAKVLKNVGLDRLNHNLNTSRSHTPNIVSTHLYDDRINTIKAAKEAGLSNCSGMIVGMGETDDDILEVAYELRALQIPSIPINFLIPIQGNKLYDFEQLSPERCLRILCLFRFINPTAELRIGGGREGHLRSLQSLALYPANSLFVEGYLVTRGSQYNQTIQLIKESGFEIENELDPVSDQQSPAFDIDGNLDITNPKIYQTNQ